MPVVLTPRLDRLNPTLEVVAILACRVNTRTNLSRDVVGELRRTFPKLTLHATIRESVRVMEEWSFAKPITRYASSSSGAEDFRAAAAELLTRLGKRT